MNEIKYSFIMAAYNAEKYIDFAIQSVLKQSYSNWELIIVNDGSTDATECIIQRYQSQDTRIKLVTTEHLGTAAKARNKALEYLTGTYAQILDSDDYISKDFLAYCNAKLEKEPFDILIPDAICITNENEIVWEKKPPDNNYNQILNGETAFLYSLTWIIHGCFLVKCDLLKRIKYDPELINGDEFTTRKLFYNSNRISFVQGVYYYRKNLESTTLSSKNRIKMMYCIVTDVNLYHYSIENHMSSECIYITQKHLIKSVVSYQLKFEKLKYLLNKDDLERIEALLASIYKLISIKMLCKCLCLHSLIILLSLRSYTLFSAEIKLISKIY